MALIAVDMQTIPKLKVRIANSKEGRYVLYNKVARQHCVWVIWHSFRFAHKHVNTFHVFFHSFFQPASFLWQAKCMQISNFTNDKRLEASCCCLEVPAGSTPLLCSALLSHNLCHLLCAACASKCVRVCVWVWQRQILLMPKCVCARILCSFFFFFATANPLFMHKSNRKH